MSEHVSGRETILVVDDEEPVRRTFLEWLESASLDCRLLAAADAEAALVLANQHTIDLAILDWNLGAGNDGLRLLEDLYVFNPDVVAIMITGYAHQATPLDAMRMGVRDYLDKNQDLNRTSFLNAVHKQLERIRPAKRQRQLHRSLLAFRAALEKVMALAQTTAALNDPVPLPRAIGGLMRFLIRGTSAREGVLIVRRYDAARNPPEFCRAYDSHGAPLAQPLVPFSRSLAGSVVGQQQPLRIKLSDPRSAMGVVDWQPFESGRQSLLAAPLEIADGIHAVLELFDKHDGAGKPAEFTAADVELTAAAAEFGSAMIRHSLSERQANEVLLDAVAAAMRAGETVAQTLAPSPAGQTHGQPDTVLEQLRQSLRESPQPVVAPDQSVRLAEAVRVLAVKHGPAAVDYCTRLVENLGTLLDTITGNGEIGS